MLLISKGKSYAHFLPTFPSLKSNHAAFMPCLAIFPIISTNAYYGNGLASHTVKNLVNMRVWGFLNQFGRFTPFLFSCLFCALFAHFLQNQQGQFCALFKILESRAPSGFATFFLRKILTAFYVLFPFILRTFSHCHFIQATIQFFLHILGDMSVNG